MSRPSTKKPIETSSKPWRGRVAEKWMQTVSHFPHNLLRSVPLADWYVVELIVLEVAHRLHFDYGIELERIDEAEVLPLTLLSSSGLIHETSQRYFCIRHENVV